jgi:2-methylcitrate dehydratase PrpD
VKKLDMEAKDRLDWSTTGEDASATSTLCQYLVDATYESLPQDVRKLAKLCILDSIGCAVGGSTLARSHILLATFQAMRGNDDAVVLGTDQRLPVLHAAYLNSHFANALDFDDTQLGHPGATVIPSALAVGQHLKVTGEEFILATVLGYEVGLRVGSAIKPSVERWRQVAASSTHQTMGAVAVACKLMGLSLEQTVMAMGLSGANAPVPAIRKFGTLDGGNISWLKNNYAAATWAGILGAQLAEQGFVGPGSILDGDRGFWIMAGSDRCDFDKFTSGLGSEFQIRQVSFKPYPCCRYLHPAIDGVRAICVEQSLDPRQIRRIEIGSVSHVRTFMNRRPLEPLDGQFSLPYAVAMAAIGIPPGYDWYSSITFANPIVTDLADKVHFAVDPGAEALFAQGSPFQTVVKISTDSATYQQRVDQPLGHPRNPLSLDALQGKFHSLVDPVWGKSRATLILERISHLEECSDISALLAES